MKIRQEDPATRDYQFGRSGIILEDTPEGVAQAIRTRLLLMAGEWFLDTTEGTDYQQILGYGTQGTRDLEIRDRIVSTPGVLELLEYTSQQTQDRRLVVRARVSTLYGAAQFTTEF